MKPRSCGKKAVNIMAVCILLCFVLENGSFSIGVKNIVIYLLARCCQASGYSMHSVSHFISET